MNKGTVAFLRGLVVLTLLLARPVLVRSADTIIVGVSGPAINMIYSFVARDAGLWQKYGVDSRVVLFEAGSLLAQAMLSGDVMYGLTMPTPGISKKVSIKMDEVDKFVAENPDALPTCLPDRQAAPAGQAGTAQEPSSPVLQQA